MYYKYVKIFIGINLPIFFRLLALAGYTVQVGCLKCLPII